MNAENLDFDVRTVRTPTARARAPQWIIPAVRVSMLVADLAISAASFVVAFCIREGGPVLNHSGSGLIWSDGFAPYGAVLILVVPIRVFINLYYDLYRLRGEYSFLNDALRILKSSTIGSLLIVAFTFLYRGGFIFRSFSYARGVFILDAFLAFSAFLAIRLVVRGVQMFARRRGINLIPTLVVGHGREASLFIREVRERPSLGYRILGVVESGEIGDNEREEFEGVPLLGDFKGLPELIRKSGANEVVITDPKISGDALFEVMMSIGRGKGVEFRIAPSLFNCLPRKTEIDQIGALPVITLFREPLSSGARILKRTVDIIISATAIAILSPLWLLIALLIRLDSRGPVFYKQERVGMDGRVFLFYKFRSMRVDSDDLAHRQYQERLIRGSADANQGDEERPVYKLATDPRVTRVGKVLRRLSLDELPQLLNVL